MGLFKLLLVKILLINSSIFFAQAPDTLWTKTYGGSLSENGYAIIQTSDSGYVISGETFSFGAGASDVWLIRTDINGDTLWTKTYGDGGGSYESARSIRQTSDDGFIIAGTVYNAVSNVLLIRIDTNGDTLWTKTFGGFDTDNGYSVLQTVDNGFIICGTTRSYHQFGFGSSVWLIRTDSDGDTLWTKTYGGSSYQGGYSIAHTADSGFIITGSYNNGGSILTDVWLLRTDSSGDTLWTKTFGGDGSQEGSVVLQTSDSGYIVGGNFGFGNLWLIRTDSSGDTLWTRTYQGALDQTESIDQLNDGGFIITGSDINGDALLIRTDDAGDSLWTKTLGGSGSDNGSAVLQILDGGFIVCGSTDTYGAGGYDVWLIRIEAEEPIPVELSSFSAIVNDGVELTWVTATEKNNRGFEIERKNFSLNEWRSIAFVEGHGTTTEIHNYSFQDKSVSSGTYYYRLKQIDFDGTIEYLPEIEVDMTITPDLFELSQNYPNPFNPLTRIRFTSGSEEKAVLKVFNINGEEIALLFKDNLESGKIYEVEFNAAEKSSGVYYYTLLQGSKIKAEKMILLK